MNETLTNILHDETLRQSLYPATSKGIYMAHAGVAPLCAAGMLGAKAYAEFSAGGDQERDGFLQGLPESEIHPRAVMAELIGAQRVSEISLLGPTAMGLNLVALGLDWQAGDEVVFYQEDYPSNVYPWRQLEKQGVVLKPVQTQGPGWVQLSDVEAQLSDRTKLVSLASAHFLSGYRIDYLGIGKMLTERGILFCLDGIQTFGSGPHDLSNVDFAAADSHKWILGPVGAGVFYVNQRSRHLLRPALLGSWNVYSPNFVAQTDLDHFYEGGRGYEPGSLNQLGNWGMAFAAKHLLEIGLEAIHHRVLELHDRLKLPLLELGYESILPDADWERDPNAKGSVVTVRHPSCSMEKIKEVFEMNRITASIRHDKNQEEWLRLSPYYYNTDAEIEVVLTSLKEVLA